MQCCMFIILSLERWKQKDQKLISFSAKYLRYCLKNNKNNPNENVEVIILVDGEDWPWLPCPHGLGFKRRVPPYLAFACS